jgi:acyl-CoA synthetase (AMP-forming)/AMP-acid ligase II
MTNLGDLISRSNKEAIIEESGKTITFETLENLAQSIAVYLSELPRSNIGLISDNSINFIAAYLGILKAGHTAVLISSKFPNTTIDYILKDAGISLIFSDKEVNDVKRISLKDLDQYPSKEFNSYQPTESDIAVIIYTSGSTGVAKGVKLSHKNHRWILEQRVKAHKFSQARIIIAAPCYHMNGLSVLESSLLGGATAILMPQFEANQFVNLIEKYSVNLITSVPSMMALCIPLVQQQKKNVSSVRQIIMASAPVSKRLYQEVKEMFPSANVKIAYGITEVGPGIFGKHPRLATPEMSVGYPLPGIEYRLVNSILEIKSPSMLDSYTNIASKLTSDGYFVTGDIFSVDENGFYFFQGRADDMFVSGGHNIYPGKIEEVLQRNDCIDSVAVVGLPDDIKGYKPYAFVKLKSKDAMLSVKQHAQENLPIYEIPRQFFEVESWPLSPIGKVDKKALISLAEKLLG